MKLFIKIYTLILQKKLQDNIFLARSVLNCLFLARTSSLIFSARLARYMHNLMQDLAIKILAKLAYRPLSALNLKINILPGLAARQPSRQP